MKKMKFFSVFILLFSAGSLFLAFKPGKEVAVSASLDWCHNYTEYACKTSNNEAGIGCEAIRGKCKKEKACTAVSSLSADQYFTTAELQAWPNVDLSGNAPFRQHMISIDWFCQ